jgi:hypothetical protein
VRPLDAFYSRGFDTAWSLYAYYGGPYSPSMQANVVAGCFAFGRTYRVGANPVPVPSPYLVKVFSINGGRCADQTLPCAAVSAPYPYTQPSQLISVVQSQGWAIIQGYKFVTGTSSVSGYSWDCTGADPASHWLTKSELYCYDDWKSVVESIPDTSRVVGTAEMAQAQGRVMRGAVTSIRLAPATAVVKPGAAQAFTATGLDAGGRTTGDVTAETTFSITGAGTCTGNMCSAPEGTYTVTGTHGPTGATASAVLTVTNGPRITSFTPAGGFTGTVVTVSGSGFTGATGVWIGGIAVPFTVLSATEIRATVSAGALTGKIGVRTPSGTTTSTGTFAVRPRITGFSPGSGPVGSSVTIRGTGLRGVTGVTFNGVAASFRVTSYTSVVAIVPAGATTGPIMVRSLGGTATSGTAFAVGNASGAIPRSARLGPAP